MSKNTADIQAKTLDFVQAVGEIGSLVKKQAEGALAGTEQARPLTQKVADALLKEKLIKEDEKEDALKLASTHKGALQLVLNLNRYMGEAKRASSQMPQVKLGQGIPNKGHEKKASYESTESPFVGRRAGQGEKRASDRVLFERLGISFPDEVK